MKVSRVQSRLLTGRGPFLWAVVLVLLLEAWAQPPAVAPASDPQALSLAGQAIAALTKGTAISDATLTGTAAWSLGSDQETGTFTLLVRGTGESRIDLSLNNGTRSEVRDNSQGYPQGEWTTPDGIVHYFALHNCWSDASWPFPALSSLGAALSNPNVVLSYVGQESLGSEPVQHIRAMTFVPGQSANETAFIQQLSTVDFYLDGASYLPVATTFNIHAEDDANKNIPTEILFTNYQSFNGFLIPTRIQKALNGEVVLDLTITSAVFNSGLPASDFTIQ